MALKSSAINRSTSPMKLVEENYDESKDVMDQKRKKMEESQKVRSRILILFLISKYIGIQLAWLLRPVL